MADPSQFFAHHRLLYAASVAGAGAALLYSAIEAGGSTTRYRRLAYLALAALTAMELTGLAVEGVRARRERA